MKKFWKAEEIFKNFPDDQKSKIFTAAEGKLIYFPKNKAKNQSINIDQVEIEYSKGKSYKKIAEALGMNAMRICRIIGQERIKFSKERIEYWKQQGLSLREIARLYKKSHEAIR